MAHIDELLRSAVSGQTMTVPASWGQGRTAFGGLSAALLYQAMTNELADERELRVQTLQFVAPLMTDEPFTLRVTHLRDGKNVTQMQAQLIQHEQVAVQAIAAFGKQRKSKIAIDTEPTTLPMAPEKANWIPQIPKVIPKFHRHIDLKIDQGGAPFTGKKTAEYAGWMRFTLPPETMTVAHIIALIDVWPPTVLQQLKWPAPASTLSWNVELVHPNPVISGKQWLYYDCQTEQANDGYAHTVAKVYLSDGTLLALSRQLVTVFA